MKAFHNDPKIKNFYIERIKAHALADEIIQGKYWENGRGCAVGCTLHSDQHSSYETELGIPKKLAYLEDRIFEKLPLELAKKWPLQFLESIEVGADLSKVWPKFAIFLLTDPTQCNSRHPQCEIVANNFRNELDGQTINWPEVRSDAANAYYAADAADAANYAAAAAANYAAADAADAAANYAANAYYAADAAAAAAADAANYAAAAAADAAADAADAAYYPYYVRQAYIAQSEKLIEVLKECK